MSPWLLEAEALVNGEDDLLASPGSQSAIPTCAAWGFEPARLFDVPEVELNPSNPSEELADPNDDFIGDMDELDQVGLFSSPGLTESPSAPNSDAQPCPPILFGGDSLASTATSFASPFKASTPSPDIKVGAMTAGPGTAFEESNRGGPLMGLSAGSAGPHEYTIGEKVSYWSGSKGVWLPAVVVEKKSSMVYLIDKQMKGCLAKVRASELISAAEEKQDHVLRALAAFGEQPTTSRPTTPRPSRAAAGTPRSECGTPRSDGGRRARPGGADVACRSPRQLPPLGATRGGKSPRASPEPDNGGTRPRGSLQKAPAIKAALPPALAGLGCSATGQYTPSPRTLARGKIVRDDFSDDDDSD